MTVLDDSFDDGKRVIFSVKFLRLLSLISAIIGAIAFVLPFITLKSTNDEALLKLMQGFTGYQKVETIVLYDLIAPNNYLYETKKLADNAILYSTIVLFAVKSIPFILTLIGISWLFKWYKVIITASIVLLLAEGVLVYNFYKIGIVRLEIGGYILILSNIILMMYFYFVEEDYLENDD
jgi:hypothetical protein